MMGQRPRPMAAEGGIMRTQHLKKGGKIESRRGLFKIYRQE